MAAQLSPEIAAQPATKGQLVSLLHTLMAMIKNNRPPVADSVNSAVLLKVESQVAECVKQSTLEDYLCFVLADFRGLQARMAALEKAPTNPAAPGDLEKIASMERRLSRHAQHLSALETRLKAVEHK